MCFWNRQIRWPVCWRALQVVPPHVFHLQFLVLDMDRFLAKTPRSWFTLPYQVHWQLITTLANASLQLSLVQLYLQICQLSRFLIGIVSNKIFPLIIQIYLPLSSAMTFSNNLGQCVIANISSRFIHCCYLMARCCALFFPLDFKGKIHYCGCTYPLFHWKIACCR